MPESISKKQLPEQVPELPPRGGGEGSGTGRAARVRGAIRSPSGFTLAELVMVCAILTILGALVLPVAKFSVKRAKEAQLRQSLREMRNAIDEYKRFSDAGLIEIELGAEGYPTELEQLIEPIELIGQVDKQKRFLRRIPTDPMTGEAEWGLRSYQDDWDADSWGGENVFDVYSLSEGTGMDGVPYRLW